MIEVRIKCEVCGLEGTLDMEIYNGVCITPESGRESLIGLLSAARANRETGTKWQRQGLEGTVVNDAPDVCSDLCAEVWEQRRKALKSGEAAIHTPGDSSSN